MDSVLCAVCGSWSCGAKTPAQQLSWRTDSWETAGSTWRAVGFLPGSKRTARPDCVPGEVLFRASSGPCHQGCCASHPARARPLRHRRFMSRDAAPVVLPAESFASEEVSDEELPSQSNMWCLLLEAANHHSIGGNLAMIMCHSSKAALSQSCHFALIVNPVARSSTDQFLTLCGVHLEYERVSQAACLQRRQE